MFEAVARVGGRTQPVVVRINGQQPTFRLATDSLEKKALLDLHPALLDLMEIAATVFAADGAIPRGGPTRPNMGEDWYRRFDLEIPVRNPELWQRTEVAAALCEAVETLTGDSVSFRFMPAEPGPLQQRYLDFDPAGATFRADEVLLFSGGLDSLAGALERLATTSSRVVLVTHRSAQKVIPRQVRLGQYLADRFSGRVLHVHVLARRVEQAAADSTQRSRTLLFSALGQAVAQAFGARRIRFFENGIVSHNLPLSPQIVSTMATRTTHPLALTNIRRLMQLVVSDAAPIENPFQWSTKSEVVSRIHEYGAASQIPLAVSCTSIREQDKLYTHCGACTQCFDRRFAILHAGLAEHDPDEIYATDVLVGERLSERSVTMAVEWTRHALRLGKLDEKGFMESFGHEASRILRGHSDLPPKTALELTLKMHHRHSRAVHDVLENVLRERAADLVAHRLPETSLVRLHLGSGDALLQQVPEYLRRQFIREPNGDGDEVDEIDEVPQPGAPLRVRFYIDEGSHVVDVIGLASVTGRSARVPHALKPSFDEDRRNGVAPEDHQYRVGTTLPDLTDMNKGTIRKLVQRCRKQLAEEYRQLHGEPPPNTC
ncbi:7-cyano-7-deazaguanine synthase [Microbaculum marinum]|uniref:7-cyano-7-deazaguanine synthase n=1 Tax=Microbaculum marinum TaxID=1764581 RepID=A0AAW9RBC6_9HYPH